MKIIANGNYELAAQLIADEFRDRPVHVTVDGAWPAVVTGELIATAVEHGTGEQQLIVQQRDGTHVIVPLSDATAIARAVDASLLIDVPDPRRTGDDEMPIYSGPVHDAHRWLDAGTYDATDGTGEHRLTLIVDECASAAEYA